MRPGKQQVGCSEILTQQNYFLLEFVIEPNSALKCRKLTQATCEVVSFMEEFLQKSVVIFASPLCFIFQDCVVVSVSRMYSILKIYFGLAIIRRLYVQVPIFTETYFKSPPKSSRRYKYCCPAILHLRAAPRSVDNINIRLFLFTLQRRFISGLITGFTHIWNILAV